MRDGRVVCVIEEERLTRYRHGLPAEFKKLFNQFNFSFGYIPWASIQYCLDAGEIGIDDIDAFVLPGYLQRARGMLPIRDTSKIVFADEPLHGAHHFWHALSTFLASPFDTAAVMIVDGDGDSSNETYEAETGYLFKNRQGDYAQIFKNRYPWRRHGVFNAGIGWTYEYVSMMLGFGNRDLDIADAGKTMGLAPYGAPNEDLLAPWIGRDQFALDFCGFHDWLVRSGNGRRFEKGRERDVLIQNEECISQYAKDVAFKVQSEVENALVHLAQALQSATDAANLCLAGGVAMNCVANGKILAHTAFSRVFVPPAPADNGLAIGLAYYGHLKVAPHVPVQPIQNASSGKDYGDDIRLDLLQRAGLPYERFQHDGDLAADAALALSQGRIIGWCQGGSEYGPRAFGHRSVIADPRSADIKDVLNAKVKFREGFRPFAPSVLAEAASQVFEFDAPSPYMSFVAPVRVEWRARVPGIVHIDGTARIQTVDARHEPLYYRLIEAFHQHTGIPLVLNTSFNLRGMPIVESPYDALRCFLFTEMDRLYLGRFRLTSPSHDALFFALAPGWRYIMESHGGRGGAGPHAVALCGPSA